MCDELDGVLQARASLDVVLESYLRLPQAKALDLATPRGFDQAVARLAAELRGTTAKTETDAVRQAIAALDVD